MMRSSVFELLVGDHGTRVHVAALHVVEGERLACRLELGGCDLASCVGCHDLRELRAGEDAVARDAELAHLDA